SILILSSSFTNITEPFFDQRTSLPFIGVEFHDEIFVAKLFDIRNGGGGSGAKYFIQDSRLVGINDLVNIEWPFFYRKTCFLQQSKCTVARNACEDGSCSEVWSDGLVANNKNDIHRSDLLNIFVFKSIGPKYLVVTFFPCFCGSIHGCSIVACSFCITNP